MKYLWQDGDAERLVSVFTHQVERDDREDVPGSGARLPTHQLLSPARNLRETVQSERKKSQVSQKTQNARHAQE